jgi:uncharacterized membrane protein YfcA
MINSIAGGGTLLTFPALIAFGIPPLVANATSTVALWPGALGSMVGYMPRLRGAGRWATVFAIPSLAGGAVGAVLLLHTGSDRFDRIVPWLVIGATGLFAIQGPIGRYVRRTTSAPLPLDPRHRHVPHLSFVAMTCQFFVGIYGGYFGAGIGILMLAVLGLMGFTDIHRMNGMKNWGGLCINFVAACLFAFSGIVDWPVAIAMAGGATAGGYVASRAAQRVRQQLVRRAVIAIGAVSGLWLLWERVAS